MLAKVSEMARKHPDLVFCILPNDYLASKMGVNRQEKFRRFRDFEARYMDFWDFVGTEE
jgi:hypothetical protein